MTPSEIEFIENSINSEKKEFYYFRDKYALQLLNYHVNNSIKINELKNCRFSSFLHKQLVKNIIKTCGSGLLTNQNLSEFMTSEGRVFNYTLTRWGEYTKNRNDSWYQTSRPGLNMVLQMNFDAWHNYQYCQLIRSHYPNRDPFINGSHPVLKGKGFTLGWCRLDIDLNSGEALIEEVQNDWLREVNSLYKEINSDSKKIQRRRHWFFSYYSADDFMVYFHTLYHYFKMWDEALLSLAIHFLRDEIGINTIYFHQYESGNILKRLEYSKPPRSLYTSLPKRFGFEQTDEAPTFLRTEKFLRKVFRHHNLRWWVINI